MEQDKLNELKTKLEALISEYKVQLVVVPSILASNTFQFNIQIVPLDEKQNKTDQAPA